MIQFSAGRLTTGSPEARTFSAGSAFNELGAGGRLSYIHAKIGRINVAVQLQPCSLYRFPRRRLVSSSWRSSWRRCAPSPPTLPVIHRPNHRSSSDRPGSKARLARRCARPAGHRCAARTADHSSALRRNTSRSRTTPNPPAGTHAAAYATRNARKIVPAESTASRGKLFLASGGG